MTKKEKSKSKKAQSQIITTVLLILLVLAAITIIWQVIQTFTKDKLSNPTACIDAIGVLEIDEDSCYTNDDPRKVQLTVQRKLKESDIEGFDMIITTDSNAEVFEVIDEEETPNMVMDDEFGTTTLQIPNQGEQKSYKITTTIPNTDNIKHLEISPITNNKKCNPIEKVEIKVCP